ncbi:MAG: HlyD family efflux transporter periplasmic adaptor subunit [Clostridia bacterium]
MKEDIKKKIVKYGTLLLLAIIVLYVGYAIYRLIEKPTDTFLVENGSLSFEETVQGYIIRDETVVKGENYKNGMAQIKTEGERIAKGESIFRYYTKGEEDLIQKIRSLDIKIADAWESENNIFSSDIKLIEQHIEEKLNVAYHTNDLQKVKEYKKDLNNYITKKAKIAGEKSPAGSYLKKLIEERSSYENQLNQGSEYVDSPRAGLVSYRVDGLEEKLTPSDFGILSKEMLENLHLKTGQIVTTSEESGKVIDNFACYIACILDSDSSKEAEIGDSVKLRLSNAKVVDASVEYIAQQNDKENLFVFKIEKYVEELVNYRKISLDVIWWNATGWKVPNAAIQYEREDLAYVIRKRAGYADKIYVKVLKQNDKYAIIDNYEKSTELQEKGVSEEEIKNRRKISLYDEITL